MPDKRIQNFLLSCCAVVFLTGACSGSGKDENKQVCLDKAVQYLKAGNQQAAVLQLQKTIQAAPDFSQAHSELAKIYLEQNEPAKAFQEYLHAADIDPENIDANIKTGQFYLLGNKLDLARKYLKQALKSDPENDEVLVLMARLELMADNPDAAVKLIKEKGKEADTSLKWLGLRAQIFKNQKKFDEAEKILKKGVAANPNNITACMMLLNLYQETSEGNKAKALVEQMAAHFPKAPQPHLILAGFYQKTGQLARTEKELKKIIELVPDKALPLLQLAEFYKQNNLLNQAQQIVAEGLKKFPDDNSLKVEEASLLFEEDDIEGVRSKLKALKEKIPDAVDVRLLEARILFEEGKQSESNEILLQLVREYPEWSSPWYYLAITELSRGESRQALNAINKAIEFTPSDTRYYTFRSQLLLNTRHFVDAEQNAKMALRLNPSNIRAAIILGRAFVGQQKLKEARTIFENLNKAISDQPNILESLAIISLGSKDKKAGEKYLQQLLTIDPGHNHGLQLYLNLKYSGDVKGAIGYINQQLKKAPEDFRLYLALGGLLEKEKDYEGALAAFNRAKKVSDKNPAVYLATGHILASLGKTEEALKEYEDLLNIQPRSLPANMAIASLLVTRNDNSAAIKYYEAVLQISPNYTPAVNNLAWLLTTVQGGDLGRALQLAMKAKQSFPDNPQIADTLGWVHLKRKSWPLAIGQFQLALTKSPDDPEILFHLALAQKESGDFASAKETFAKIDMSRDFLQKPEAEKLQHELEL
jgi:tetratricopeptide (TPR) repeat protein